MLRNALLFLAVLVCTTQAIPQMALKTGGFFQKQDPAILTDFLDHVPMKQDDDNVLCVLPSQMTTDVVMSSLNNTTILSTIMGTSFIDYDSLQGRFDGSIFMFDGNNEPNRVDFAAFTNYNTMTQYVLDVDSGSCVSQPIPGNYNITTPVIPLKGTNFYGLNYVAGSALVGTIGWDNPPANVPSTLTLSAGCMPVSSQAFINEDGNTYMTTSSYYNLIPSVDSDVFLLPAACSHVNQMIDSNKLKMVANVFLHRFH